LEDLKRGLACGVGGDNLTIQNGSIGVDGGDGLCYGFEFVGVIGTAPRKELDVRTLFDSLDSVAIPLHFVLPSRSGRELRNSRCQHRQYESRIGHDLVSPGPSNAQDFH